MSESRLAHEKAVDLAISKETTEKDSGFAKTG